MNSQDFKKFLFKIAFSVIVIDGEIHDNEIEELKLIDKKTTYFSDTDLSEELNDLIEAFKNDGTAMVENIINKIKDFDLNQVQELLVLEVALRIIHADERYDESEKKFIRLLRSKLRVADELIRQRFGEIAILRTEQTEIIEVKDPGERFKKLGRMEEAELESLTEVDFSELNDEDS